MARSRVSVVLVVVGLWVSAAWLVQLVIRNAEGQQAPSAAEIPGHAHGEHQHAPIPAAYANARIPDRVWTDPRMIARGKEIFIAKCALCHGQNGDGKGPGAANLPLKPADLTDGKMVAEMAGSYWLWRVSEGGLVEPFRSKGSVMPAWKGELSLSDRWAVIAYAHTLSGHTGPHVASEHPELGPRPRLVTGEGTVVAVHPEKQQIVLEHGAIEGFMGAMTMGYRANPTSLLDRVQAGDRVRFTIDTESSAITTIDKLK